MRARSASAQLALLSTAEKNAMLVAIADAIEKRESEILKAILSHQAGRGGCDAGSHLLLLGLAVFRHEKSRRTRVMIPQAESAAK